MTEQLTVGSLFTGYGGLDLAVEAYWDARTVWVSDIDPGSKKILTHRFPHAPNIGNVKDVDWSTLPPIDILTGGYPCQPFSKAGHRKGTNDDRHLWPYVRDAIRALRPRVTILENVSGHRSLGFDRVLGDMAEDGMDVRWTSLRAADVGAPHNRERVFIAVTNPGRQRHGAGQDGAGLGRLGRHDEGETSERERAWTVAGDRVGAAAAHSDSQGLPRTSSRTSDARSDLAGSIAGTFDWGRYTDAVRRWEQRTGRLAPVPDRSGRVQEWMMGLPDGWICDVPGIRQAQALKAAGNGVVPQQAFEAQRRLFG